MSNRTLIINKDNTMSIVDVADEIVPAANEITLVDVGFSDKKVIYLLQEI